MCVCVCARMFLCLQTLSKACRDDMGDVALITPSNRIVGGGHSLFAYDYNSLSQPDLADDTNGGCVCVGASVCACARACVCATVFYRVQLCASVSVSPCVCACVCVSPAVSLCVYNPTSATFITAAGPDVRVCACVYACVGAGSCYCWSLCTCILLCECLCVPFCVHLCSCFRQRRCVKLCVCVCAGVGCDHWPAGPGVS